MAVAVMSAPFVTFAQTQIRPPSNSYSVSDDVRLGQQVSAEVERQLPLVRDREVEQYIERLGRRLVDSIPRQYQQPHFRYTFKVVNARDINAFALPGGPMYLNRGMIEAAQNEGGVAGVMAHEMSHIALRHATASVPQQQRGAILGTIGSILGSIIGGVPGAIIGTGAQVGAAAYVTRYTREFETQADILGAQIMAYAGYDPRDLSRMFQIIEQQSGGRGGPEWLSSHPNPGNRYARINQEAALLRVSGTAGNTAEFHRIQSRLRSMGQAPTTEEILRSGRRTADGSDSRYPSDARISTNVPRPSTRYSTHALGNLARLNVPSNWRKFEDHSSVSFVPDGAYDNQASMTHGVMVGFTRMQNRDLRAASDEYIRALLQNNPHLRQTSGYGRGTISGRTALSMTLAGPSNLTGRTEVATVYTAMLRNGDLWYVVTVVPDNEQRAYQNAFATVLRSIQLYD